MSELEATPRPVPLGRTLGDRILGGVGIGCIILAIVVLVRGGATDGESAAAFPAAAPAVVLLEPRDGADVSGPLPLVFDPGVELTPSAAGWSAGDAFHLHARVNGTELMPGRSDVQRVGGTRYRWTLPALPAGEHTLRLVWSDEAHRPVAEGGSREVRVRVR